MSSNSRLLPSRARGILFFLIGGAGLLAVDCAGRLDPRAVPLLCTAPLGLFVLMFSMAWSATVGDEAAALRALGAACLYAAALLGLLLLWRWTSGALRRSGAFLPGRSLLIGGLVSAVLYGLCARHIFRSPFA